MVLDFSAVISDENVIYEAPYYVIFSMLFLLVISDFKSVGIIDLIKG
jgi:hypothetical protein